MAFFRFKNCNPYKYLILLQPKLAFSPYFSVYLKDNLISHPLDIWYNKVIIDVVLDRFITYDFQTNKGAFL